MPRIRPAQEDDLAGLAAICYADRPAIHRDRIRASGQQPVQYFVIEVSGQIVGFGLLVFQHPPDWSDSAENFPLMIDLFVAEPYRSQGIGRALISHLEAVARHHGHEVIYLSVEPKANPRALALYLRLGYVPLQTEPYQETWQFTDSEGVVHRGEEWLIDMRKQL